MSLRAFHLVFIAVSVALCAFVAAWGLREWQGHHSGGALAMAVIFFASGVALIGYGVHAVRRFREME